MWKKHALQRMMERAISRQSVKEAVLYGAIIEQYPNDYPIPSLLIAAPIPTPLHVVLAWNADTSECHIITAYPPDITHFESDLITRR